MPAFVPGREYLSSARANLLKVPYNKKEASLKLSALELNFSGKRDLNNRLYVMDYKLWFLDKWLGDMSKLKQQKDHCISMLNLGAYSVPRAVLASKKLDLHVRDVLKKELMKFSSDLRMGLAAVLPARSIGSVLSDFVRISSDHFPYCFINRTKDCIY